MITTSDTRGSVTASRISRRYSVVLVRHLPGDALASRLMIRCSSAHALIVSGGGGFARCCARRITVRIFVSSEIEGRNSLKELRSFAVEDRFDLGSCEPCEFRRDFARDCK